MRRDMDGRFSRGRWLPLRGRLLAGGAVLFLSLAVAGCGSQGLETPLFGPFAGYTWHGRVRQVSAVLVVPQLTGCADNGIAGTWIGAQGPLNPRTQVGSFFQVGVNEECDPTTVDGYYAFWSSTTEHFRPRRLFDLNPGDVVRLSMHRNGGRWLISVNDRSMDERQSVAVQLSPHTRLSAATWHQEDVSNLATNNAFPYPTMTPVRFSDLRVDDRRPPAAALTTIWMSAGRAFYGPSPLHRGAFAITRIHPSADALHYGRIALQQDLATYLFDAELASWTPATGSRTIKAQATRFARVTQTDVRRLRSYRWPARVRAPMRRLVAADETLRNVLLSPRIGSRSYIRAVRSFLRQHTIANAGLAVRGQLHMGITDLSVITIAAYVRAHSG